MNTTVSFPLAKLLKEKGFANTTPHILKRNYYNYLGELNGDCTDYIRAYVGKKDTKPFKITEAPSIATVVMWLYEKHGIFVIVNIPYEEFGKFSAEIWGRNSEDNTKILLLDGMSVFDSIEKAYEEGILESLKLI